MSTSVYIRPITEAPSKQEVQKLLTTTLQAIPLGSTFTTDQFSHLLDAIMRELAPQSMIGISTCYQFLRAHPGLKVGNINVAKSRSFCGWTRVSGEYVPWDDAASETAPTPEAETSKSEDGSPWYNLAVTQDAMINGILRVLGIEQTVETKTDPVAAVKALLQEKAGEVNPERVNPTCTEPQGEVGSWRELAQRYDTFITGIFDALDIEQDVATRSNPVAAVQELLREKREQVEQLERKKQEELANVHTCLASSLKTLGLPEKALGTIGDLAVEIETALAHLQSSLDLSCDVLGSVAVKSNPGIFELAFAISSKLKEIHSELIQDGALLVSPCARPKSVSLALSHNRAALTQSVVPALCEIYSLLHSNAIPEEHDSLVYLASDARDRLRRGSEIAPAVADDEVALVSDNEIDPLHLLVQSVLDAASTTSDSPVKMFGIEFPYSVTRMLRIPTKLHASASDMRLESHDVILQMCWTEGEAGAPAEDGILPPVIINPTL